MRHFSYFLITWQHRNPDAFLRKSKIQLPKNTIKKRNMSLRRSRKWEKVSAGCVTERKSPYRIPSAVNIFT
jgi:hypothetical protein